MLTRVVVVVVVALAWSPAAADTRIAPADRAGAQAAMEDYFHGEIRGGYLLAGLGLGGLVSGALLFRSASATNKGLSYPLLTVGLLHLVAGVYVGIASSRRLDAFTDDIARDPSAFVAAERERMKGVSRTFTALKIAEVTLVAGGLAMAAVGRRTDRPRLQGAGLAIALEMALTFGFDVWASARAHDYRDRLAAVDVQAALLGDAPAAMLTHTGSF